MEYLKYDEMDCRGLFRKATGPRHLFHQSFEEKAYGYLSLTKRDDKRSYPVTGVVDKNSIPPTFRGNSTA
jgi:hypothetical protein